MIWNGKILTVTCFIDNYTLIIYQIWLHILSLKRKIYRIFWADLFWLHTAMTKIGKVRIMPLFAAYGDIAYFKQNLSLYHISNIWIEIIDIFASKSRLLFQKEFSWSWIGQRFFVDVKWLGREVISEQSQSGKFDLHLNLSWNTEIGSFHHPLYRAPWFNMALINLSARLYSHLTDSLVVFY